MTATIRKGILDPSLVGGTPELLVYGMMAALLAAGTAANRQHDVLPVSTTHSIVGALVGFAAVGISVDAVNWGKVSTIVAIGWFPGSCRHDLFRPVYERTETDPQY